MSPGLLDDLQDYLWREIPLTRAMQLQVVAQEAEPGFALQAPVAANSNHLRTAFGGSINAVATLAGYSYLWLISPDTSHVVARSEIQFLRPIRQTIHAVCEPLSGQPRKRSTLKVNLFDEENGPLSATFLGEFVRTGFQNSGSGGL